MKFKKYSWLVVISTIVVIIDQYTKLIVAKNFFLGESVPVIKDFFHLTYVQNTGAAFGMLGKLPEWIRVPFFVSVPIIALIFVAYYYHKTSEKQKLMLISFSLIAGGAIGNLIDRARLNYVIDFFHFFIKEWSFAVFNVADMAITIGVGLVMLLMGIEEYKQKKGA